jgi:hypothetical protein
MILIYVLSIVIFLVNLGQIHCSDDLYKVQNEIVNRHDFEYTLNPGHRICNKSDDIFVLIYVHTKPDNFKRRLSLRETWAKRSMFRNTRVVFMMGSTSDKKVNELLRLESGIYNDIVQENFVDAYRNLTYKGIMAMKWISEYCTNAKYILKVDDDIISNIFIVLRHLKKLQENKMLENRTVMCLVWQNMKVIREKDSKWYVSKDEFMNDTYGPYCSGSAYIFTPDLPSLFYNVSFYIKFFWVDDYFITGLLARGVGVSLKQLNSVYIINRKLVEQRFKGKQSEYTAFGHLPNHLNGLYNVWKFILERQLYMHPNLNLPVATLIQENDFSYLPDLKWSFSF